jgi:uncharacterized protein YbaR (Trm112 family)
MDSVDYLCCPACKGELRLTVEDQSEIEVVEGALDCLLCKKTFKIEEGLAKLMFPDTLEESDLRNKIYHDQHPDYNSRPWALLINWSLRRMPAC